MLAKTLTNQSNMTTHGEIGKEEPKHPFSQKTR